MLSVSSINKHQNELHGSHKSLCLARLLSSGTPALIQYTFMQRQLYSA